ncbi:hypothetical protein [Jeotgalibacillus aurantiacus]|uniref:hypothetical protein n=1 Tax=Jeotgalibacillus aurantiacus TaxID=2763266 RepID=UPI001D0ABCD8|nr:hypothetical protein [Jeotgalibacillus aurantiacus]
MKKRRNFDADSMMKYLLTAGLLMIIMAFFIPGFVVILIQDLLFFSADHWSFIRPMDAFLAFGTGMVIIGLTLISFLFTKLYAEKKRKTYRLTGVHILLIVLTLPLFVFSVYHYAYLNEDGAQANSFWSLSEQSIAWEEVEEVTRIVDEESLRVYSYTFSSDTGEVTIPYDPTDRETVRAIGFVVDSYGWELNDVFGTEEDVPF